MGTYMKAVAEVKCADGWVLVDTPVFPHPLPDWDTVTKDRRPFVEAPFYWQSYSMFGLFAGIRNDSQSAVLAEPRGVPVDISKDAAAKVIGYNYPTDTFGSWMGVEEPEQSLVEQVREAAKSSEDYGHSWLLAKELFQFDYDAHFADMREIPPRQVTYREFFGELYFQHLDVLKTLGHPESVRIIFWFND